VSHSPVMPPSTRLPFAVYVLAAGTFLMGTTEFVVAGLLPELAADFGTSEARAGLSITVFALGMIIGAPVMPLLTLRLPRRVTLMLALLVYAGAHVVSALTHSFTLLLAARFVAAVATGTFWAVAAVAATAAVGRGRSSTALGVVLGGGMLANVLGVPLGALAGHLLGWRGPFWALAVLAAVAAVAVVRAVPADPRSTGSGNAPSVRSEIAALRSGRLWAVLFICTAVNAGVLSVYSFISPVLTSRSGVPATVVPVALLLFGIGAFVGNLLGGRLGDSRPFTTMTATAMASLAACLLLCALSSWAVPGLLAFGVLGLVGLSANPILVALTVRYGGDGATLPSAMATAMFNLGTAAGTAITATLLDTSIGTLGPPLVGVGFGILVFLPLAVLRRAGDPVGSDSLSASR
jgi:DHA1 family chloramphenicol resistance protein-like MFS transporter